VLIINSVIYLLHFGEMEISIDAAAHSERAQVIRYDIGPGSVERSRNEHTDCTKHMQFVNHSLAV
jgi:hypothetical protein